MSNTADLMNLFVDLLLPTNIPVHKYLSPVPILPALPVERIVINAIPNSNVTRWGTNRMNRFLVNVNCFIPKTAKGEVNSGRIAIVEKLIIDTIEAYNATSTRVKYYSLDPLPGSVFNEDEKETLLNIRVETAIT